MRNGCRLALGSRYKSDALWAKSGHPKVTTPTIGGTISAPRQAEQPNAVTPHSGSYRFARNRSKEDRRDSPALLSGLGSQELRGVYRLI